MRLKLVLLQSLLLVFLLALFVNTQDEYGDEFDQVLDYDMNVESSYVPEADEDTKTLNVLDDVKKNFKNVFDKSNQQKTVNKSLSTNAAVSSKQPKKTKKQREYRKEQSTNELWNSLKPLFGLVGVGGASFHPYKNEMVYVSNLPGVLQIYRVKINRKTNKASAPVRLVNTKNRCSAPRYLFDGSILYLHDRGGNENFQIGLITNKDEHIWLTHNKKAKHLVNTVTKNYMYFQSNSRNKKKFDIYRRPFPLEEKSEPELIYTPDEGIARAGLVSQDETKVILSQHYSNVHSEILLLDLVDKTVTSLTKPLSGDRHIRWQPVKFLNKAHTKMLVKTDFQSEYLRLAVLSFEDDMKSSKAEFITIPGMEAIKHDVTGMTSNYKTKHSYIELNKDGYSELIRIKIGPHGFRGKVKTVVLPVRKGVIAHGDARSFGHGMSVSRDGNLMALSMTSSKNPVNLYMLELNHNVGFHERHAQTLQLRKKKKRATFWPLLPSRLPSALKNIEFLDEKLIKFTSFDGTPIHYFLFKPDTKPPPGGYPTIIKLHGGPESQSRPTFNAVTQFLLKSGFAVAMPNIRGSRGYGRAFLNKDNQEKRLDAIHDVKTVALDLAKRDGIDGKRLVVMGGSYGGYATQLTLVTYPDMWKAGVSVVGMSNLETFFKHTAEWRRRLRYQEYGNYHTQIDLLRRISPINHVEKIQCPVFIIQGENDERVPVSEAIQMYERLKQVAKEPGKEHISKSVLLTFPDEGHGLSKKVNREKAYKQLITWLKKIV
jgi:pimeloyl-ACP methyl ester carboxylesterase